MGHKKDVSESLKEEIVQFLLEGSNGGKLTRGKINEAAAKYSLCRKSISRLWKAAKQQRASGATLIKIVSQRIGKHPPKLHRLKHDSIETVNYQNRGTIRSLAESINVSKSTVGRWVKDNLFRAHTNAIKPELTAPNKVLRLCFSLQAIKLNKASNSLTFKPMDIVIHIDEKWFYQTKNTHRYYMTHKEDDPYRYCKSKKFIPKVMFMCAVCRPIFGEDGNLLFNGKIGIWPFVEEVEAKRNSKTRQRGTIETKPIESITKQVIKDCILNQLVPAIKAKWPSFVSKEVIIQQDNARPHICNNDPEFRQVASADGFNIKLVQQPANSPDVNVNDLGFFRAIQSLQQKHACRNAKDLVHAVVTSYNDLEPMTLNKVFLTLQSCLQEISKVKGCNRYMIPHMKKDALIMQNELPRNLEVQKELVEESITYLMAAGHGVGIEQLMTDLGMQFG